MQPVHCEVSMRALLSSYISAGQPSSLMHFLQPIHRSFCTAEAAAAFPSAMQGDLKMIALTPGRSAVLLTVWTASRRSSGLTISTAVSPIASSMRSMLTFSTTWPIMVRPVPGCGWCPVMAVVELSSTISVRSA